MFKTSVLLLHVDTCNSCAFNFIAGSGDLSMNNSLLTEWVHGLGLTTHDEDVLVKGACLTANHITAAMKLLKLQNPKQNGLQDTSSLAQKLVWRSKSENFIQIIYVDPGHWACLSNIFCEEYTVDLFDSNHTAPSTGGSIIPQCSAILGSKNFAINLVNVGLQIGGTDCGLFSIAIATSLADCADPCSFNYIQLKMRKHLQHCFSTEHLSPFPCHPRKVEQRILCTFRVEDSKTVIKGTQVLAATHCIHVQVYCLSNLFCTMLYIVCSANKFTSNQNWP